MWQGRSQNQLEWKGNIESVPPKFSITDRIETRVLLHAVIVLKEYNQYTKYYGEDLVVLIREVHYQKCQWWQGKYRHQDCKIQTRHLVLLLNSAIVLEVQYQIQKTIMLGTRKVTNFSVHAISNVIIIQNNYLELRQVLRKTNNETIYIMRYILTLLSKQFKLPISHLI